MAARLRLMQWLLKWGKVFGVLYILILALAYLSPTVRMDRTLSAVLDTVFVNHATGYVHVEHQLGFSTIEKMTIVDSFYFTTVLLTTGKYRKP